jgi:hypothetical protein
VVSWSGDMCLESDKGQEVNGEWLVVNIKWYVVKCVWWYVCSEW